MKNEILEEVLNAKKNIIVEGEVASGKTTNILFQTVKDAIEKKENLLILDAKEEYINEYYNKLKKNNYNTIILNWRDMDKSEGWNPLEYPYHLYQKGNIDKAQEYLEKIGKIMFYEDATQDPFWSQTASDFFIGLTLALFEDGKEEEINLNSIHSMFNGIDKKFGTKDYISLYFASKDPTSKSYIFASPTFLAPSDTKGSILAVVRQKLRLYVSREKLSYFMNKTTFDLENIGKNPTAIFLIARDENKSLNALAAMFIEQLYAVLLEEKNTSKWNFVLDNFDIIEKCNDLVEILESGIARDKKTFLATRSIEKLTHTYGEYILKLCNIISIQNKDIKVEIGDTKRSIEKDFKEITKKEENINYPTLKKNSIKIFDLENAINENRKPRNIDFNKLKEKKVNNVDDLIRKIDQKIIELEAKEKEKERLSFKEMVTLKIKDPKERERVIKYFMEEENLSEPVARVCFKDIARQEEVLKEFIKYLEERDYDIKGSVSINGYTAKKIHELNSTLKPCGVYAFLNYLKEKPEEAEETIRKGFPNKDVKFDNGF